tara:strand:+ start:1560 stop:1850 length:291 start_codon:yes stop_codon:yes gene_type:complete
MTDRVMALAAQITDDATADRIAEAQAVLEVAGYTVLPFGVLQEISGHLDDGLVACRDRLADELMDHTDVKGDTGKLVAKVYVVAPVMLTAAQRQAI